MGHTATGALLTLHKTWRHLEMGHDDRNSPKLTPWGMLALAPTAAAAARSERTNRLTSLLMGMSGWSSCMRQQLRRESKRLPAEVARRGDRSHASPGKLVIDGGGAAAASSVAAVEAASGPPPRLFLS